MSSILLSAAVTCLGSLALGQGALAIFGARSWSWIAPPVGLALMILIAVPAIHIPGRASTTAIVMALVIGAAIVLWIRRPAQRPPLRDLLCGVPVALLVLVPFLAVGRAGTLGMSFDNDMAAHLLLAEGYRSAAVASIWPLLPGYPLGPHALTGTLAQGLGVRTDLAFAGLTAATPVLLAWTALASIRKGRWPARLLVATVAGIPFLIAAYYAEGSFKELMEALFVLGAALALAGGQPELGWRRWLPMALIGAGAVSVYSLQGLVWPVLLVAIWFLGRVATIAWRSTARGAWHFARGEILPGAAGVGLLVLVLIPQIPRVEKFVSTGTNNSIAKTNLGNLVGPLSGWEAFGSWGTPDFRVTPPDAIGTGMWAAFVLALVILGALLLIRGERWMLPLAAASAMLVWAYTAHSQSPYVAAKALVVASPILLVVAALAVGERHPGTLRLPSWRTMAPLLAVLLLGRVLVSSWEALRAGKVGARDHLLELRSLEPLMRGERTLYLGDDDFIDWEMPNVRITAAYFAGVAEVPLRPEKAFAYGQALDFDTVSASTLNEFQWVITTRDAAASQAPAGLQPFRSTPSYILWHRTGTVAPRKVLAEGQNAGAKLDCATSAGRALVRAGGVAAVRMPTREVAVPPLPPGIHATVDLPLTAGKWMLETPYYSPLPIQVSAPGLLARIPANLERPGPRWPVGSLTVSSAVTVPITFSVQKHWLTPTSDVSAPTTLIAVPQVVEQTVPMRRACGRIVDWYQN